MIEQWDYEGEFLKQFPRYQQGVIANQVCWAIRGGAKDLDKVVEWVKADAIRKCARADGEALEGQQLLLQVIETDECYRFIEFILDREALPETEKRRLKDASRLKKAMEVVKDDPPSLKQLTYLEGLGHPTDQMPATKGEAGKLIDGYLAKSKERRIAERAK